MKPRSDASPANPVRTEIPFDNILDHVTGSDPSVTGKRPLVQPA
jgi:hypothetical protein